MEIKDLFNPLNITAFTDRRCEYVTDGVITGIQTYHKNNNKPTLANLTSVEYWFEKHDNKRGYIARHVRKLRKTVLHVQIADKWISTAIFTPAQK